VLARIAEAAAGDAPAVIVEVGAGHGSLTLHLASKAPPAGCVLAIEIDEDLAPGLADRAEDEPRIRPINRDVLTLDIADLTAQHDGETPVRVVGNVPYNITTPIIAWLLAQPGAWDRAVLMMQKEVAQRLATTPGERGCGSISLFVHYHATVRALFDVGMGAFTPRPRVRSSVVELTPRPEPAVAVADEQLFFSITRQAFQQRRKMLRGALRPIGADAVAAIGAADVDPTRRGETLTIEEFASIANVLHASRVVT
jgi:16S rRNA (adenine1518-N6/adenine1519-N6)-dimethyltransferase